MAQSIPSMPIPPPPPPQGICRVFVILFWKSCKCPTMGVKNGVQMPHPGKTPKLYFQFIFHFQAANTIFMGNLNLIKTYEAPYANRPQLPVMIVAKITSIWLTSMTKLWTRSLIIPFLFSKTFNIVNEKERQLLFARRPNKVIEIACFDSKLQ